MFSLAWNCLSGCTRTCPRQTEEAGQGPSWDPLLGRDARTSFFIANYFLARNLGTSGVCGLPKNKALPAHIRPIIALQIRRSTHQLKIDCRAVFKNNDLDLSPRPVSWMGRPCSPHRSRKLARPDEENIRNSSFLLFSRRNRESSTSNRVAVGPHYKDVMLF